MPESISAPRVLLGVCGGIAAFKVPAVVRQLRAAGCEVQVIPTPASLNFVGATTWEAISGQPVYLHTTDGADQVVHVKSGANADVVVIAPATANTMAKIAAGMADNLLTASMLMTTSPVLMAPAMHTQMWQNAATQANVKTLQERGVKFVGPAVGRLTGKDSGPGRMSEPEEIVAAVLETLVEQGKLAAGAAGTKLAGDLAGLEVVISAGGTREPIDPVRYISNRSTGRMGVELASQAQARGARVHLVAANISESVLAQLPAGVVVHPVETTEQLAQAMEERRAADVVVMSAAVSDYRVAHRSETKLKRDGNTTLELVENPDILAGLAASKREGQTVVGFAAETGDSAADFLEYGKAKARRKGADLLVINEVGVGRGFGDVDTAVTIVNARGESLGQTSGSKADAARAIIDAIVSFRNNK